MLARSRPRPPGFAMAYALRDASPVVPPPPPAGLNYIPLIKIAVRDLLIAHSFSILLLALLVALLYFSTSRSRRQPIFLLNVFTILLALSVGALIDYQTVCYHALWLYKLTEHSCNRYKR